MRDFALKNQGVSSKKRQFFVFYKKSINEIDRMCLLLFAYW